MDLVESNGSLPLVYDHYHLRDDGLETWIHFGPYTRPASMGLPLHNLSWCTKNRISSIYDKLGISAVQTNVTLQVAQKLAPFVLYALTLTNFQNYFTVRIRRKYVITLSLKIPPHLKCVATLPCEMSSVLKATMENETASVCNNTF